MDILAVNWFDAAVAQIDGQVLDESQRNAIVELFEISSKDPVRAFSVICQILATNPRKDVLGYLGAGPLEDLLINNCCYIDVVIEVAKKNKLLSDCLKHVNLEIEDCPNAQTLHDYLDNLDKATY